MRKKVKKVKKAQTGTRAMASAISRIPAAQKAVAKSERQKNGGQVPSRRPACEKSS